MTAPDPGARQAQIAERAAKATPGPWIATPPEYELCVYCLEADEHLDGCQDCQCIEAAGIEGAFTVELEDFFGMTEDTAEFCAHARADIPWLLERVAALEEVLGYVTSCPICGAEPWVNIDCPLCLRVSDLTKAEAPDAHA